MHRYLAGVTVALLASATPAFGVFEAVETFNGLSLGPLNGQNGWASSNANHAVAADPTLAGNQVMVVPAGTPTDQTSYKTIPTIANGSTAATLFFRVRRAGQVNMSWGASDVATPTAGFGDYESQFNIQDGTTTVLRARSAGVAEPVETFAADTWYNTWMVINNSADTYEVYMQGGALADVTKLADDDGANVGNTVFGFRNGAAANDLIRTLIRNGVNHTADFFLDDIYIDTAGQNLSNPVPEPGAMGITAVAAGAVLLRRRRSRNT